MRVEIQLAPGAHAGLAAAPEDALAVDPIEHALGLRTSLRPHLNYYSARGGVLELPASAAGYMAAILYWAPLRAAVYRRRVQRELAVAELRAVEEEQILRYIGEAAELKLEAVADSAQAEAALRARGYKPLCTALVHRPEYATEEELRARAVGPEASFDYILDLRARDLVCAAAATRRARLTELRAAARVAAAQLAEAPVSGASVWRAELDEFAAAAARLRAAGPA